MSSLTVTFVQADGKEIVCDDGMEGESLMDVAKSHRVAGIIGDCCGGCICATCHVLVPEQWWDAVGEPGDMEDLTLDYTGDARRPNSRLSCQIILRSELNGLTVAVAPGD